jgi:hypothetical protein
MARGGAIRYLLLADASGVKKGTQEAEGHLKQLNDSGTKAFGGLKSAIAGVGGAFAAIGVAKFAGDTIKAAEDAQASAARVQRAVENAGLSYDKFGGHIDAVIQKQSKLAALDDEDLADSFAKIVTRTHDVNEALALNATAADVARGRQISLEAATQLVIKAHDGNVGALKRVGVAVQPVTAAVDRLKASNAHYTQGQLDAAKATDKAATAQKATAALQQAYAGQSEAYGKTAAGAADRLKVAWENFQESIGQKVLPVITRVFTFISNHIDTITRLGTVVGGTALAIVGISKAVNTWKTAQSLFNGVMSASPVWRIAAVALAVGGALVTAYKRSETFRNVVQTAMSIAKRAFDGVLSVVRAIGDAIDYVIQRLPFVDVGGRRAQAQANLATSVQGRQPRTPGVHLPTKPVQGPPAPGKQSAQEFVRGSKKGPALLTGEALTLPQQQDLAAETLGIDITTPGELAMAMASLTADVADDLKAAQTIVDEATQKLREAKGPAAYVQAAQALKSAQDSLASLGPMQVLPDGTVVPLKQSTDTDTSAPATADLQAQLAQAQQQALNAARGQAASDAFVRTAFGSGDIGSGGPVININTLHPGDPQTLAAVASAAASGFGMQGYVPATSGSAGI